MNNVTDTTEALVKYREEQKQLNDAKTAAQRNLPPALAALIVAELNFHLGRTWLGIAPNIRALVTELNDMELERKWK